MHPFFLCFRLNGYFENDKFVGKPPPGVQQKQCSNQCGTKPLSQQDLRFSIFMFIALCVMLETISSVGRSLMDATKGMCTVMKPIFCVFDL